MEANAPLRRLRTRVGEHPRRTAFAGVFSAVICCFIAIGTVLPILPQYVKGPIGAGDVAVGIVVGAFAFTAVIGRPIGGRMADRSGRRRVVVLGMLIASAAGLLYLLPLGVGGLVFARLILGIGDGWVFTAGATWIVDLAPPERRGRVIGLFGLAVWGGLTVGPLLGEWVKHLAGYDAVFVVSALLPLVGAAIASRVPDHHVPVAVTPEEPAVRTPFVPRGVILPGISLSLVNVGYGTVAGFIVLHMAAEGVPQGTAVFTAFAASVVFGRVVLGSLPDRLGPVRMTLVAGGAEAIGLGTLALASSLPVALAGAAIMGASFSLLFPSLALIALSRTPDDQRGAALGAVTAFFDIGVGLGAPLAGLAVALSGGYPAAFWFAALCAAGGGLTMIALLRPRSGQNVSGHGLPAWPAAHRLPGVGGPQLPPDGRARHRAHRRRSDGPDPQSAGADAGRGDRP